MTPKGSDEYGSKVKPPLSPIMEDTRSRRWLILHHPTGRTARACSMTVARALTILGWAVSDVIVVDGGPIKKQTPFIVINGTANFYPMQDQPKEG